MKVLPLLTIAALLAASTPTAVWDNKDFAAWTLEDAQQILQHSPWVKEWRIPGSQRPGVVYVDTDPSTNPSSPPSAELGNNNNSTDRTTPPPSSRAPSLVTAPVGAPASPSLLRIIWASARPVRLAFLKTRSGNNPPSADDLERIERHWTSYVIAVVGLPAPEPGSDSKAMSRDAFLSVPGKTPAVATDADYRRIGTEDVYFFHFMKTALPVTTTEGSIEFKLNTGRMKITQKFNLADMTYHGQLAL